jgi:hypothetical protein
LLFDLSTTPLIFSIDEDAAFEVDFVPALRYFASLILEGKYDLIGGCIRTPGQVCSSYTYVLPDETGSGASPSHYSTFVRTLKINSIKLLPTSNVVKVDAVDNLFLATKTALQTIRFDPQIEVGAHIDFFL